MQVEPRQQALTLTTSDGGNLALHPGKHVVARVIDSAADGSSATISLAGESMKVSTSQPLVAGQTLDLTVTSNDAGRLQLTLSTRAAGEATSVPRPQLEPMSITSPEASRTLTDVAPTAIRELARAGVPVTPQLAQAAARVVEQMLASDPSMDPTTAARSVASLVVRDHEAVPPPRTTDLANSVSAPPLTGRDAVAAPGRSGTSAGTPGDGRGANDAGAMRQPPSFNAPPATTASQSAARMGNATGAPASSQGQAPATAADQPDAPLEAPAARQPAAARPAPPPTSGTPVTVAAALEPPAEAATSLAHLVTRDHTGAAAAGARVAAALQVAGQLGERLSALARISPQVAAAMPRDMPPADAIRQMLAPALDAPELAMARIVQSMQPDAAQSRAGVGSPPPSVNPTVVASYIASRMAAAGRMDELIQAMTRQPTSTMLDADLVATPPAVGSSAMPRVPREGVPPAVQSPSPEVRDPRSTAPPAGVLPDSRSGTPVERARAEAAVQLRPASGAAAASAPAVAQSGTPPPVAAAVSNLAIAVVRFVPALVPGESSSRSAGSTQVRLTSEVDLRTPGGSFTPIAAGGGSDGGPAPLVNALREVLLGATSRSPASLVSALAGHSEQEIAAALTQLPQRDTMRIAGDLLQYAQQRATGSSDMDQSLAGLRGAIHDALHRLGNALHHQQPDALAALRTALQEVATSDSRPEVARQAMQLLQAADGQILLSQPQAGADPGYVWFQVPLPGNRNAEVLVRRDPARRAVSFERFDIAFLLSTESLGTLLLHLEADPSSVRCSIRTDDPDAEPIISRHAGELREPIEREARRPLHVTTGVFENAAAPTSLLEPALGLVPGENAYYA